MFRQQYFRIGLSLIVALFLWTVSGAKPAAAAPELTCNSLSTGGWNTAARWSCGRVPTAADTVTIDTGDIVTLDTNTANIISLTVNGTLSIGNNGAARTVNVAGNTTVAAGGVLQAATSANHILNVGGNLTVDGTLTVGFATNVTGDLTVNGTMNVGNNTTARTITIGGSTLINLGGALQVTNNSVTHILNAGGNLTNNGTFNARLDANSLMNVTFNDNANQTVSGTGATNNFNLITINNTGAANNNTVEITSTNFAPANGFLTLTDGILKLSGSYTLSNNVFAVAGYTIPAAAGLWLNNPNITVTAQGTEIDLNGSLQITAGTYNIGTGTNDHLRYGNGARFTMEGGTLSITGFFRADAVGNTITFNMSGGTITTSNFTGDSDSDTSGNFDIIAAGSSFTMSGGTIIIRRENVGTAPDYRNIAGTVSITGGTVQFGNNSSIAGETYSVGVTSGTTSLPNVVLNQTNPPTVTLGRPANIIGSLTINSGTTFVANGQALNISGNWTNNGTFTSGTQTTTFNGTAPQTISGSSVTGFSTWVVNSGATVVVPDTNIPTAAVAVTNNGTLQQTRTVNNANVQFLTISTDRYRGVDINTTGTAANLGAVTVSVRGNSGLTCPNAGGASPVYALRCFDITPTTQGAAAVTLWATTAEQNGILTSNLTAFRFSSSWEQLTNVTNGTGSNNYVFATGDTPGFSSFLLGDSGFSPTAITLEQVGVVQGMSWLWVVLTGLLLLVSAAWWVKRAASNQ